MSLPDDPNLSFFPPELQPAYSALVVRRMPLVSWIKRYSIEPDDLRQLLEITLHRLWLFEGASSRVMSFDRNTRLSVRRLSERDWFRINQALEFFLSQAVSVDDTAIQFFLQDALRNQLVAQVQLGLNRLEYGKRAIQNVKLIGVIKPLANSYQAIPDQISDPEERLRVARNANWVRLLSGRSVMSQRTLVNQHLITHEQAASVAEHTARWRRSCEKVR